MKSLLTIILTASIYINANCQIILANDSAETGPSASQMTFYSLQTGVKTTVANNDWHLAVTVRPTQFPASPLGGTTIRINEQLGVKVYYVPNTNAAGFSALDIIGYQSWTKLHDSDSFIDDGALNSNRNLTNYYDFGWGTYNAVNHNVTGDSLYLIQLPNGALKKFIVVNLAYDSAFNIKYSNIDNSELQNIHISKKDYVGKEFVYLNLLNNVVQDKEPLSADWDLQFLKYSASDILLNQYVPIVGVWLNKGDSAAMRSGHDANDNNYSNLTFSGKLNAIGWDWKYPGNFLTLLSGKNISDFPEFYVTRDSLAYFVKTRTNEFYKIVFTRYNSTNGRIYFYKEALGNATGIDETSAEKVSIGIYPNPASSVLNVVQNATSPVTIRIVDMAGRIISENITSENISQLNTSEMAEGVYLLAITGKGKTATKRFVVSR